MTIRVPGNWGVPEGALYEEITEPGDVVFEWPDAPPGSKVTYDLAQAPADSTATATLSGAIDGADLPGAYVLERTCSLMGHAVRKDVAVAFLNTAAEVTDLTAPTPPAPQSLASSATTASLTWTHAGAPGGTTYAVAIVDSEDDEIAPDSGTGLGPWVIPVVSGRAYIATITATAPDGQTAQSSALVAVAAAASTAGAWTQIGEVNFVGATEQTFSTTGDKMVTLADTRTIAVNAANTAGAIASTTSGVDADRGLIIDVPPAIASTAIRLRVSVPVSPSVAATDDLLVSVKWRPNLATGTVQRALVGLVPSGGTEVSSSFSGVVFQNSTGDAVKLQTRKASTVADVAASVPTGWRNASTLVQTDVRVVGSARSLLAAAAPRLVSSGTPTYVADIGGDSSGPEVALEAPLFSGATIFVILYSWNGGASPAVATAVESITIYSRASTRVP